MAIDVRCGDTRKGRVRREGVVATSHTRPQCRHTRTHAVSGTRAARSPRLAGSSIAPRAPSRDPAAAAA
eukprot:763593-Prymnesium_polylepis.1